MIGSTVKQGDCFAGVLECSVGVRCNVKNLSAQTKVKAVTLKGCPRVLSDALGCLGAP